MEDEKNTFYRKRHFLLLTFLFEGAYTAGIYQDIFGCICGHTEGSALNEKSIDRAGRMGRP